MFEHKSFINITVLVLTLIASLDLALFSPWLVNFHTNAAENQIDFKEKFAKEVSTDNTQLNREEDQTARAGKKNSQIYMIWCWQQYRHKAVIYE